MDSPPAKEFQLVTPLQMRASSAADYGAFPAKSPMARECSVGIQFVMDKKQRVRVHQVVLGTVGVKRRCCVVLRGVLHVCCSVLQCVAVWCSDVMTKSSGFVCMTSRTRCSLSMPRNKWRRACKVRVQIEFSTRIYCTATHRNTMQHTEFHLTVLQEFAAAAAGRAREREKEREKKKGRESECVFVFFAKVCRLRSQSESECTIYCILSKNLLDAAYIYICTCIYTCTYIYMCRI